LIKKVRFGESYNFGYLDRQIPMPPNKTASDTTERLKFGK